MIYWLMTGKVEISIAYLWYVNTNGRRNMESKLGNQKQELRFLERKLASAVDKLRMYNDVKSRYLVI